MNTPEMVAKIQHATRMLYRAQVSGNTDTIITRTQQLNAIIRSIELMSEMIARPNRWPRTRLIWNFGFLSIWMRRQFRPHYRWLKRDRSLLAFGCVGVVVLLTVPPWLANYEVVVKPCAKKE